MTKKKKNTSAGNSFQSGAFKTQFSWIEFISNTLNGQIKK